MNLPAEQVFADGNMNPVVRIGNEVRRSLPIGWQGSHAVLSHLERKGFAYSPRLLRTDQTHEWLSFMPGSSISAELSEFMGDDLVIQVGQLIRQLHDALADFVVPVGIDWTPQIGVPEGASTICHCDIGPWNIVVQDGEVTGLIDWDLAHPAPVTWDLAYAAWRFAPLYDEPQFGDVAEKARRIRLLLDSYDLPENARPGFVDMIRRRAQSAFDTVEILGKQGLPGFAQLYRQRLHWAGLPLDWLDRHRQTLIDLIEPR